MSGDGRVSFGEFMAICDKYGVQLSQEGKGKLASLFVFHGEVDDLLKNKGFKRSNCRW